MPNMKETKQERWMREGKPQRQAECFRACREQRNTAVERAEITDATTIMRNQHTRTRARPHATHAPFMSNLDSQ